jgi:hypothetical protein
VQNSDWFLGSLILAALTFQVWVTMKVRLSSQYDSDQKSAQTKLIWLLPVIGAAVAFSVLEKEDDKRPPDREQRG